ncbi:MAG: hypothetical protein RL033_3036 [Pseudomonadota bacterium]
MQGSRVGNRARAVARGDGWRAWLGPLPRCRSLALVGFLVLLSCKAGNSAQSPPPPLRVATSYSLEDSGLFAAISDKFTRQTNRAVQPFFVGTGEGLGLGRAGKVDLAWVHSRPQEDAFIVEGYGLNRRDVMFSEYVIVGPPSDPALIGGLSSAVEAFGALARGQAPFVSRADDSGNHTRELSLWKLASVEPEAPWYIALHAGMLPALRHASERGAYVLADLPTYIINQKELQLKVLVRGDTRLHNPYGIVAVNPSRMSGTDYAGAMAFIDFVTSPSVQALIADFGRAQYGASLFQPLATTGAAE